MGEAYGDDARDGDGQESESEETRSSWSEHQVGLKEECWDGEEY